MPQWRLRPWSSAIAMPKCSWMSGMSRSGRVFRKPPHSAKFEVIGPRRSRRYWPIARSSRGRALQREAVEVRIVGHVAEHEIRMVLQVLSDARQMMHAGDAVLAKRCARRRRRTASGVAGSGTRRRRRSPRAARGSASSPCPAGIRRRPRACLRTGCGWHAPGFDAQIGAAAHMGMDIGARRAPAFAVLLRHLVDAEAFMLVAIEIVADAELAPRARPAEKSPARDCRCAAC